MIGMPVWRRSRAGRCLFLAAILSVFFISPWTPNTAAEEGFVSLMPKKDISEHWTVEVSPPETWQLKDGMIYCLGKPNGFLRSKKI
ncbi:MAG: hypothetical protein WD733_12095 [Bryobacterales bacterium]